MVEENLEFDLEAAIESAENKGTEVVVKKDDQPSLEETIISLQKQVDESNKLVREATDRATRLEGERQVEVSKTFSAIDAVFREKEMAIESRLSATKSSLDSIKQQLKAARTEGNIDAETDLTDKLADERYQFNALTWEKNNLASHKRQREEAAKQTISDQQTERKYTSREQDWIEKHPRYNTDDEYQSVVWSLDALAKKRGIRPDTDAYYDFVNKGIDKYFPDEQSTSGSQATRQASAASTAAPVSRSASTVQRIGQNGSKVRLSSDQLEAAEACGMTPIEYAQDLMNIENEKQGRA